MSRWNARNRLTIRAKLGRSALSRLALACALLLIVAGGAAGTRTETQGRATSVASVPTDIKIDLRDAYEIVVRDVAPWEINPELELSPIVPEDAIERVAESFPIPDRSKVAAYLVRVTDPNLGETSEEDGTVTPLHADRLAWLVIIHDYEYESMGGSNQTFVGALCTFVDAGSGEVLFSVTARTA